MRSVTHSYEQLCPQENISVLSSNSCYNTGKKRAAPISLCKAGDYHSIDVILSASKAVRRQEYCNYIYVARRGFLIYQMLFKNPSPISKSCKCSLRAGKGFSRVIDLQSSSRKTEKKKWLENASLYFNHEKTPGVKGHCRAAWERTAKHLQAETENILKLLAIQIITQAHL